mmetsp:Transcript_5567/g.12941  ORF Transcript_5567/g.12941 Transcript_5567/m.12941 type:complete len:417 (-) Transcript_5567:764-2014(-)
MVRDLVQDFLDKNQRVFGQTSVTPNHLTHGLLDLTFAKKGADPTNEFGCWNDSDHEIIQQLEELSKQTKARERRRVLDIGGHQDTSVTFIKFHKSSVKTTKGSSPVDMPPLQEGKKDQVSSPPVDGRLKSIDLTEQFNINGPDFNPRKPSHFFASRPRRDASLKIVELVNRSFPQPDKKQWSEILRRNDPNLLITNLSPSKDDVATQRPELRGRSEEHRPKLGSKDRVEKGLLEEQRDFLSSLSINAFQGGSRGRGSKVGGSASHSEKTESVSSNSSAGRSNESKSSTVSEPVSHEHLHSILDVHRLAAHRSEALLKDQVQRLRIHREEDSDSENSKDMEAGPQPHLPAVRKHRLGMRRRRGTLKSHARASPDHDFLPAIIVSFSPKRANARLRLDKLDRGAISESDMEYARDDDR